MTSYSQLRQEIFLNNLTLWVTLNLEEWYLTYCTRSSSKKLTLSNFKNFYVGRYSLKSQAEMIQEPGIKDVWLLRYNTSKFLEITELNHKNQQRKYYFQNCPKQNISIIFAMLYELTILITEYLLQIEIKYFYCKFNDIRFIFNPAFVEKCFYGS